MRRHSTQIGFSLIELVVVIAIIGIIASFAIPSYQQMVQNTKIRTATESILSGFQIARAEAVKRNASVQLEFGVGSAWTVCVSPAGGGACSGANTIQTRKSSEGSSSDVTVTGAAGPYVFNGLGILTTAGATIEIDNSALSPAKSRNLRVIVGAGGAAKSCDPALDSAGTDPRRC